MWWEFTYNIIAQAAPPDGIGGFLDFINLGVLAVLVIAFYSEQIVSRKTLLRSLEDLAKKEEELQELRERLDKEVLPQLWRTTDLLAQFASEKHGSQKKID